MKIGHVFLPFCVGIPWGQKCHTGVTCAGGNLLLAAAVSWRVSLERETPHTSETPSHRPNPLWGKGSYSCCQLAGFQTTITKVLQLFKKNKNNVEMDSKVIIESQDQQVVQCSPFIIQIKALKPMERKWSIQGHSREKTLERETAREKWKGEGRYNKARWVSCCRWFIVTQEWEREMRDPQRGNLPTAGFCHPGVITSVKISGNCK